MRLASPFSAILSAVIFNALIIVVLIPLALKGVRYRPLGAAMLLRRNLLIYGLGGIIVPFIGIKLIDVVLVLDAPGLRSDDEPLPSRDVLPPAAASRAHAVPAADGAHRDRLPAGGHRHRAAAVPARRPRAASSMRDGHAVGSRAHRPELQRSALLLEPAVGDHAAALQRHRLRRLEPRSAQSRR